MKLRILVIDDDVDSDDSSMNRTSAYQSLSGSAGALHTELEFATSPVDAQDKLQRESWDVVLLDVWLRREPFTDDDLGTVFQTLFIAASNVSMVGLVSSDWDNTVVPRVNRLLVENPSIPVPLMLSFEELRTNHHAAVVMQIQAHIRRRRGGRFLELGDRDPLNIVHISDLHFGSRSATETLAGEANLDIFASALRKAMDGTPHIIAITGDVSNTGHPEEYAEAHIWLERLCAELEFPFPTQRILLVPGNHDFSIPLALSMKFRGEFGPAGEFTFEMRDVTDYSRKLARYATQGFNDFAESVTGAPTITGMKFDRCWLETAFREYGVIFSGLNTCGRVKDDAWPERWFDKDDANKINKGLRSLDTRSLFHVMLCHHPPVRTTICREPITNVDNFSTHFLQDEECRPNLILHGHEHARRGDLPWGDSLLVVCAPTPSVGEHGRLPDSLRGVNLITLNRRDGRVESAKARSMVYERDHWKVREIDPHSTIKCRPGKRASGRRSSSKRD